MMVNERLSAILRFLCHNEHFRIIYHAKITTQILNMCQHHFNMIFTCVEIKIKLFKIISKFEIGKKARLFWFPVQISPG